VPRHPLLMARFGLHALRSARGLAESFFQTDRARALFAGLAAHSIMPLEAAASAAIGIVLGATARQLLAIGGDRLPVSYRSALANFHYGPGVFKLDWALDVPIPWRHADCARAGTVHLGGTLDEIARWERSHTGAPFVLLAQPSLFDATRAPEKKHTAWAYCHVPNGSHLDMTDAIESQIERFAPGFRARILARHTMGPAELERRNPNLVGGDIGGGAMTLRQTFLRPTPLLYRTPLAGVFLCSSSTPPGGGVHGMCGYNAVRCVL
jgi:phytoene dehydrogenase-like protein